LLCFSFSSVVFNLLTAPPSGTLNFRPWAVYGPGVPVNLKSYWEDVKVFEERLYFT
jgi:hypothetical protein